MSAFITLETALDMATEADNTWEPSDAQIALSILGDEVRTLRARVAELETQQHESTGTDWAVRWPAQETDHETGIDRDVTGWDLTGETYARRVHAQYPRETELVARTNGPWLVVSP